MVADHLVYFTSGNISRRVDGEPDLVAMTPTSVPYDVMGVDDICIVSIDGKLVEGSRRPTSELPLHTLTYARRPEVGAVVHIHSPAAMAMAVKGLTLPPILIAQVGSVGGDVATAPYSRSGTSEMADLTADALRERSVCFLRFHGLLAIGRTLAGAYNGAAVVEGAADAYLRILPLGNVPTLPQAEVERLAGYWRRSWQVDSLGSFESAG
jgi:ribulose-5-phosphate 4-epimerase/fuculose-1-phosphate aldolase